MDKSLFFPKIVCYIKSPALNWIQHLHLKPKIFLLLQFLDSSLGLLQTAPTVVQTWFHPSQLIKATAESRCHFFSPGLYRAALGFFSLPSVRWPMLIPCWNFCTAQSYYLPCDLGIVVTPTTVLINGPSKVLLSLLKGRQTHWPPGLILNSHKLYCITHGTKEHHTWISFYNPKTNCDGCGWREIPGHLFY